MQNREELRKRGHDGSRKTMCREGGTNINFKRGKIYRFRTKI
jgi:hypothetical protein